MIAVQEGKEPGELSHAMCVKSYEEIEGDYTFLCVDSREIENRNSESKRIQRSKVSEFFYVSVTGLKYINELKVERENKRKLFQECGDDDQEQSETRTKKQQKGKGT